MNVTLSDTGLDENYFLSFSTNGYTHWHIFQQPEAHGLSTAKISRALLKVS